MKKLIFLLFLLPLLSIAQQKTTIDGYAGIPFGSSPAEVKDAITTQGGDFDAADSRSDTYFFTNVSFNGHNKLILTVKFFKNKFYQAALTFNAVDEEQFTNNYNNTIKEINAIYGEGSVHTEFTAPYKSGDGNELYALQHQKASYYTIWKLPGANGISNTAMLNVNYNLTLNFSVIDNTISQLVYAAEAKASLKPKSKPKAAVKKH